MTFKSHHEALDGWAMKDWSATMWPIASSSAPPRPNWLPEGEFGLYAVAARFPHNLSQQVPWQRRQPGVYDCRWGNRYHPRGRGR